jgi:hypothetical protein
MSVFDIYFHSAHYVPYSVLSIENFIFNDQYIIESAKELTGYYHYSFWEFKLKEVDVYKVFRAIAGT